MFTIESYMLGNGNLHERFFATTEVLAKIVSKAPRAVGLDQLEKATGRCAKDVGKLCAALKRAGLLRRGDDEAKAWSLTCKPCEITLEDVYRCVMGEQQTRARTTKIPAPERAVSDVDLLVMQATIAINQSVFKHLRQFSLDRLAISAAGMPSTLPYNPRSIGFDPLAPHLS